MRLDKFVHCLIVKCSLEMLDTLLTTLIYEIKNESTSGLLLLLMKDESTPGVLLLLLIKNEFTLFYC